MITRQWFGINREETLGAFGLAIRLIRKSFPSIEIGPWKANEICAIGFWTRGTDDEMDQFTTELMSEAIKESIRVAPADYAGASVP